MSSYATQLLRKKAQDRAKKRERARTRIILATTAGARDATRSTAAWYRRHRTALFISTLVILALGYHAMEQLHIMEQRRFARENAAAYAINQQKAAAHTLEQEKMRRQYEQCDHKGPLRLLHC